MLVLIVVIGILIAVMLPKAGDKDGELADKDEHEQQEVTPEELDDIIASADTETPVVTEAPKILANELIMDKNVANVMVGGTIVISAAVYPEDVTDSSVTWISDNPEIAEVDANGNVTGRSFGMTTISCKTADGSEITATCSVMVAQTPSEAFVAHLYANCFGRAASGDEIRNWAGYIDDGSVTPGQVAASFCRSDELGGASLSNEDFMKIVYRTYMNREYDQAGLDSWVSLLNEGMSRDDVLEQFANTTEFHNLLINFGLE